MMNHASLFSGIGGFDLAASWMGWENVFNCEIEPFCKKVLKYHFPDALQFGDIKQLKFKRDDGGQLWVRRDGVAENTNESRCVQRESVKERAEVREQWHVGTRNKNRIYNEPEEETWLHIPDIDIISGGFPCQPFSAAGKRRGTDDDRHLFPEMLRAIREVQPRWVVGENVYGFTNWSGGLVFRESLSQLEDEGYEVQPYIIPASAVNAPHRRDRVFIIAHRCSKSNILQSNCRINSKTNKFEGKETREFNGENSDGYFTNSTEKRLEGCDQSRSEETNKRKYLWGNTSGCSCKDRVVADTDKERQLCERKSGELGWERFGKYYSQGFKPTWDNFPTQSPLRFRDDGFSSRLDGITVSKLRNESIKAAGNAVVPQVVYEIFKAIQKYEDDVQQTTIRQDIQQLRQPDEYDGGVGVHENHRQSSDETLPG
jgi:DNA (cytosine-5)-methyltransferase 1